MFSAIEIVAEQSPEPLNSEFAIVFQQQKFGIPFRDALLQLGDRIPDPLHEAPSRLTSAPEAA